MLLGYTPDCFARGSCRFWTTAVASAYSTGMFTMYAHTIAVDTVERLRGEFSALMDVEVLEKSWVKMTSTGTYTRSWRLTPEEPPHLSTVICITPCSPAPPIVVGMQELSCIANDARIIAGTSLGTQRLVHT